MYYNGLLDLLGDISLCSFLFISGYYFVNPKKEYHPIDFIKSKIIRLYPEYLISISVIYIISRVGYLGTERNVNLFDFILNIPMLNIFVRRPYVDGAHWYITFILLLSVLFACVIKLDLLKKNSFWLTSFFAVFVFGLTLQISEISFLNSISHYVRFYLFFVSGLYVRRLFEGVTSIKSPISISAIILFILSMIMFGNLIRLPYFILALGIIMLSVKMKFPFLETIQPLIYLGDISYLIYLLHQNIGYIIINFIREKSIESPLITVTSAVIIICTIGCVIDKIEKVCGLNEKLLEISKKL
jgi:peptidoglycan/LPS O-acetylase OafA/YrhL